MDKCFHFDARANDEIVDKFIRYFYEEIKCYNALLTNQAFVKAKKNNELL